MLYYNPLIYNEHEKSNLNTYNCHMRNGMQQSRGAGSGRRRLMSGPSSTEYAVES